MAMTERAVPPSLSGQESPADCQPFEIEPASCWAGKQPPPPRDWISEDLSIAAGRVTSFLANGGFGKTTIALQVAIATARSKEVFDKRVIGGPALGFFCEDEQEEVERRARAICERQRIDLGLLDNLYLLSRDGQDNVLCTFDRDLIVLSETYWRVDATIAQIKPRLAIWDTAADAFAGDFMSTPQVRQFIKVALGGFCVRHGCAVLLIAHPSSSGMASGDGSGFSTAWNNSVRSRLFLRRPKSEDAEAIADRRVLEVRKSNYGPAGATIPLIYDRGQFVLDPEPIEEGSKAQRAPKSDTRLAMAVLAYFRAKASSGQIVAFGAIFDALRASGDIGPGDYETIRKPLQRTLKGLGNEGLLAVSQVPRGYRLVTNSQESSP